MIVRADALTYEDLAAYVQSTQRFVTGDVRVRLHRGTATVVGRRSDHSLYSISLATYGKGDAFDHKAAEGFIGVFGLPLRNQARTQALWSGDQPLALPDANASSPRRARLPATPRRLGKARTPASPKRLGKARRK